MPLNFSYSRKTVIFHTSYSPYAYASWIAQAVYTDLYVPKRPRSGSHPDLSSLAKQSAEAVRSSMAKSSSQQSLAKSDSQSNLSSPEKVDSQHNRIPKSPNPKQATVQSQDDAA